MKKRVIATLVTVTLSLAGTHVLATTIDHSAHLAGETTSTETTAAKTIDAKTIDAKTTANLPIVTQEFQVAMDNMHGPMMAGIMDSDPDTAFVKGMIPHHEGAVEMARIVLKHGTDPEIRQLAENVIRDQEKEIKMMQDWLAKHPNNQAPKK